MRILHDFKYQRPPNLASALTLLCQYRERAWPIAGGTDLVIGMKHRSILQLSDSDVFPAASRAPKLARPEIVVSLADLSELKGITRREGALRVGARATMSGIAGSYDIPSSLAALRDAAGAMGSPLIRNQATIGGNIVHARPAADTAVATVTLGARYELANINDRRVVPAHEFFVGPGETIKLADELLLSVEVPYGPHEGSAYLRQGSRRQLEIALASAAAWIKLDPAAGVVSDARIGMGAVGPTPLLAPKAAQTLIGHPPDEARVAAAAVIARDEARPIDDYRGSADYRLELVEVLVRRALESAAARALGKKGRS